MGLLATEVSADADGRPRKPLSTPFPQSSVGPSLAACVPAVGLVPSTFLKPGKESGPFPGLEMESKQGAGHVKETYTLMCWWEPSRGSSLLP